jgi:pterin-4a-carbinolamine dehydratase
MNPRTLPRRAAPPSTPFQVRLERLQAGAPLDQPALKAERIQELLQSYPGWQRDPAGPGLLRGYRFATAADAIAFAAFVAGVFESVKAAAKLEVVGPLVAVRAASLEKAGAVSQFDFDLAALIEGREE